jgi:hypothetical protein
MVNKISYIGTLDRFEAEMGVILAGEDGENSIMLSKKLLPQGSKEGDILSIKIEKKEKKTLDEKNRVEGLINKLSSNKS